MVSPKNACASNVPHSAKGLCSIRQIVMVSLILSLHAGMVAVSASRHSPTNLEPAFLVAGLSHWEFGRFDLYRVNPPLPRMIAALPVIAMGYTADWSRYDSAPGYRAEFLVGQDFMKANGPRTLQLVTYARWACIPFSLIGASFIYLWAGRLYGPNSGLLALILYSFEPNLLAHAELVTCDCACWSFGIMAGYFFWRWLQLRTWSVALVAGFALGLAQVSKLSWIPLVVVWPGLWIWTTWSQRQAARRQQSEDVGTSNRQRQTGLLQILAIELVAIYTINGAYFFEGFGIPIKDHQFVSRTLSGQTTSVTGNRFTQSWIGQIPLPLPQQYVLGIDGQLSDFESFRIPGYLRGEWKEGGWWYYYLYGLFVKVPLGILLLLAWVIVARVCGKISVTCGTDEVVLLVPALILFLLASCGSQINIHLRYVFPALAVLVIFLSQAAAFLSSRRVIVFVGCAILVLQSIASTLSIYPHHLAHFNGIAGGSLNGHRHLLSSSFHWGQDWKEVIRWLDLHPEIERCLLLDAPALPIECLDERLVRVSMPFQGDTFVDPVIDDDVSCAVVSAQHLAGLPVGESIRLTPALWIVSKPRFVRH